MKLVCESLQIFESVNSLYRSSLQDEYWKEISSKFPDYNSGGPDTQKAVNYILKYMMKKYPDNNWASIEKDMRNKIHGGLT